jgi:hypothetical protein
MAQTKKEILAKLAEVFPGAQKFIIRYEGGGDNFDSFSELQVRDNMNKNIKEYDTLEFQDKFIGLTQDYIFDSIFENAKCSPNFNNEGSSGTVTFDMLNKVVILENSYWEDITEYPDEDAGEDPNDYEYEEAEEKCEPEEF